ncbi:MAG: hypothetical protein KJO85_05105 [Gammaproteobacteria bacterium]|nr:hypothetical protein [Gammaproteobacteria bacterium]
MKKLVLFFLTLVAASCANMRSGLDINAKPDPSSAYIMGSFLQSYRKNLTGQALEIICSSEQEPVYIKLKLAKEFEGIEVVPVKPGKCEIKSLVRLGTAGDIMAKLNFIHHEDEGRFDATPGVLTYIGNFDGKSTFWSSTVFVVSGGEESVVITKYGADRLRKEIFMRYPGFTGVKVVEAIPFNAVIQAGGR